MAENVVLTTLTNLSENSPEENEQETSNTLEKCKKLVKACKNGEVQTVVELLNENAPTYYINDKREYETCLEVAIENGKRDVAEAIVKHKRWKECLKISPNVDKPFRKLIAEMPDLATEALNKCVTRKENVATFEFDFALVGGATFSSSDTTDGPYFNTNDDETLASLLSSLESGIEHMNISLSQYYSRSSHLFESKHILETMEGDMLSHPVVLSFLRWKWIRYIGVFFIMILSLYVIFLTFLTAFALTVPNPQIQACKNAGVDDYSRSNSSSIFCGVSAIRRSFIISAAVITIICSSVRLFLEMVELLHLKGLHKRVSEGGWKKIHTIIDWKYFKAPSNYMEVPLFILSIVFVSVFQHECLCPSRRQWQAGFIAVFLGWIDLVLYLDTLPLFGIYIQMLWKIIKNFLKVLIMALLLLFAFTVAFYMAFYEPDLPNTPFENPGVTFVNMISYAIGSPDISIFRLSNDDTRVESIPYPELSYSIWVIFAVIMSVLFLNLLTGLAVQDVQELQGQAQRNTIKQQIKLFRKTEVWIDRLTICCNIRQLKEKNPASDTLLLNYSAWHIIFYFIGDERKYILKKASEIQEKKEKEEKEKEAKEKQKQKEKEKEEEKQQHIA